MMMIYLKVLAFALIKDSSTILACKDLETVLLKLIK